MRQNVLIRKMLSPIKHTPFHPQWFVFKDTQNGFLEIANHTKGIVLDIGAGEQKIATFLKADCQYISLDYYKTATEWYKTKPCIFGNAQQIPIADNSVDTVLLLDVLEHLPMPEQAVSEIRRVLRPDGHCIIQVPFLYPLHDTPYDFQRWTENGLSVIAETHHFDVICQSSWGHPLETAALITNLGISRTILQWAKQKNPLFILATFLLPIIPLGNSFAWILAKISIKDNFMPHSYRAIWRKTK